MTSLRGLYQIAEQENVEIDCFDLTRRASLSIMDNDGACYIAIDPFKLASEIDEKEKLGHELGHCVTGSFYNEYTPYDIVARHEKRADKWAIHRLVPLSDLKAAVKAGYTELWELAEYFDVTEDFMRKAIWLYKHGNLDVEVDL